MRLLCLGLLGILRQSPVGAPWKPLAWGAVEAPGLT